MDVSISVQDGDSTLVRFEGCGFDSPTKPFKCSDSEASEPCVKRVPFPGQVGELLVFPNPFFFILSLNLLSTRNLFLSSFTIFMCVTH